MKRQPSFPACFPRPAARWFGVAACVAGLGAVLPGARAQQAQPKTADMDFAVATDGSLTMAIQMTFDAANWRGWKAMVGDEPARMRAQMRHQFAAMTLEDFKLERDDMNRVAKMSMHSPSGPDLREDGSLQLPVDGCFRLVNHTGRDWFFSGNNPSAGGSLNNVKVTLPTNVKEARVANADSPEQALVFALTAPPSASGWFYGAGGLLSLLGLALLGLGLRARRRAAVLVPAGYDAPSRRVAPAAVSAATPPPFMPPPSPVILPPPVPPAFVPRRLPVPEPRADDGPATPPPFPGPDSPSSPE